MSGVVPGVINRGVRKRFRLAMLLACGPLLSGCILGTERPELDLEVPANYRAAPKANADAAVPMLDWWRGFRSGELSSLIDAAQIHNLDTTVAMAQLIQAAA